MKFGNDAAINRRVLITGLGATLLLPGCMTYEPQAYSTRYDPLQDSSYGGGIEPVRPTISVDPNISSPEQMYAAMIDEGFEVPAVPYKKIKSQFYRQLVADTTGEQPGTLVVDTTNRFLYFTMPNGEALRYGVGIGREGFAWSGRAVVQWKKKWPTWTPPEEMIARDPKLAKFSAENGGMPAGLDNPLGARALYMFQNDVDTLYRLHGSPEWKSIGTAASSGCVRLMNQDIIDLYDRVPNKTPIVVLGDGTPLNAA